MKYGIAATAAFLIGASILGQKIYGNNIPALALDLDSAFYLYQ